MAVQVEPHPDLESPTLPPVVPTLPEAAEPIVLPVPLGAVKVLPRWSEEDEVVRWRLRYRVQQPGETRGMSDNGGEAAHKWMELELRSFTRELPLSDLHCGRLHYFKVALETRVGWSNWSRAVPCVPPVPVAPGKCAAVYATIRDDTTVLVRWTRPIDYAAAAACGQIRRYKLLVTWTPQRPDSRSSRRGSKEEGGDCRREIVVEEDVDEKEVSGLLHEREYCFQVAAENIAGWSEYSDPSPPMLMPPPVPPKLAAPTLRRATHHSVIVQWQHPFPSSAELDSYRFRYTTSTDWSKEVREVHGVSSSLSQTTVDCLRPGQHYIFQVRALNRHGMSIWSDDSIPLKTLDPSEPSKIQDLRVSHAYRSFITLQWAPAEPNGYEVLEHRLRCAHKPDMTDSAEIAPSVVRKGEIDTCDLRHLQKMQYYFQVAASNKLGTSEWSDPLAVDLAVPFQLEDA